MQAEGHTVAKAQGYNKGMGSCVECACVEWYHNEVMQCAAGYESTGDVLTSPHLKNAGSCTWSEPNEVCA